MRALARSRRRDAPTPSTSSARPTHRARSGQVSEATVSGYESIGIQLQDNTSPSGVNRNVNTVIENNVVYRFTDGPALWSARSGPLQGITLNYNDYYSAVGTRPLRAGSTSLDLAGWRTLTGADGNSLVADPLLADVNQFRVRTTTPYDWRAAILQTGSPSRNAGTPQSAFINNFAGAPRSTWNIGAN